VALATVDAMPQVPDIPRFDLLCVEGSPVADHGHTKKISVLTVENSPLGRLRAFTQGNPGIDMGRYDCVYTIYGPPIRKRGGAVNVSGIAYSYLFYPEVNYWGNTPLHRRPAQWARDRLRLAALRQADGWIFETEAMRGRALHQLGLEPARTAVIPPGPSPFVENPKHSPRLEETLRLLPDRPRVLLAANWHPNKNLHAVPGVARACRAMFGESPLFVLTLDPEIRGASEVASMAARLGVSNDVCFLGAVSQRSIGQVLAEVHCVMLLSELESFSSNVIEAFVTRVPLVISDRDWARAACRDAAVYVEPNDAESVARGVGQAMGAERSELVDRGAHLAKTMYLSQQARAVATLRFLTDVHGMGRVERSNR
jgi:glycosyltransferase involved in cell wall biosynthesis